MVSLRTRNLCITYMFLVHLINSNLRRWLDRSGQVFQLRHPAYTWKAESSSSVRLPGHETVWKQANKSHFWGKQRGQWQSLSLPSLWKENLFSLHLFTVLLQLANISRAFGDCLRFSVKQIKTLFTANNASSRTFAFPSAVFLEIS